MAMPSVDYVDYKNTRYKYAGKSLETKAEIDGYYESMAVGLSDNLNSNILEEDQVPYLFRTAGGSMNIGNYEKLKTIVGGTVAWNQLVKNGNFADTSNWAGQYGTISAANNKLTYTRTSVNNAARIQQSDIGFLKDHKYIIHCALTSSAATEVRISINTSPIQQIANFSLVANTKKDAFYVFTPTANASILYLYNDNNAAGSIGDTVIYENVWCVDLTLALGSTIADYIYTLEQGTAGAGVAFFKKLFPNPYYAYNAGEPISVKTSGHITTGFNQWDEQWELGTFSTTTGEKSPATNAIRNKNYIKVLPGVVYSITKPLAQIIACFYDLNYNPVQYVVESGDNASAYNLCAVFASSNAKRQFTIPNGAYYMLFRYDGVTTYSNDICINIHWDGERDGEHEPSVQHTYPLDDVELRGIFKLDANNKLYCDGDTYEPDGTVTRKRGRVNLGTLTYVLNTGLTGVDRFRIIAYADIKSCNSNAIPNIVCAKFVASDMISANNTFATWVVGQDVKDIYFYTPQGTYADAAAFKTAMSGVYLEYDLATPTTESADPYPEVQVVDDWGTEEFVDERAVPIPVGHITQYPANLKAKVEMAPESPDGDGDYVLRQTSGQNEYVPLEQVKELPDYPAVDGEYTLKVTVTGGVATLSWE